VIAWQRHISNDAQNLSKILNTLNQQAERYSSAKTLRIEMKRGYQRPWMFQVLSHTLCIKVKKGEIHFVSKDTEDISNEKTPGVKNANFIKSD